MLNIWRFFLLVLFSLSIFIPSVDAQGKNVYVVPIESTVEKGLARFFGESLRYSRDE